MAETPYAPVPMQPILLVDAILKKSRKPSTNEDIMIRFEHILPQWNDSHGFGLVIHEVPHTCSACGNATTVHLACFEESEEMNTPEQVHESYRRQQEKQEALMPLLERHFGDFEFRFRPFLAKIICEVPAPNVMIITPKGISFASVVGGDMSPEVANPAMQEAIETVGFWDALSGQPYPPKN